MFWTPVKKIAVLCFVLALVGGKTLMDSGIDFAAPAGGHAISGTVRFIQKVVTTAQDDGLGTDPSDAPAGDKKDDKKDAN